MKEELEYGVGLLSRKKGKRMRRLSRWKVVKLELCLLCSGMWVEGIFICWMRGIMELIGGLW